MNSVYVGCCLPVMKVFVREKVYCSKVSNLARRAEMNVRIWDKYKKIALILLEVL